MEHLIISEIVGGHGHVREDEAEYLERGKQLYRKLRAKLGKERMGEVLTIEPESGKYVIGRNELDAARKAQKRFPGKLLDHFRIGEEVMLKFRRFGEGRGINLKDLPVGRRSEGGRWSFNIGFTEW